MTDPYIQINGTKIEVFDNDLSAVKSIKQLTEVTSKIITATRDMTAASGNVPYTGVGFTPTSIQVIAAIAADYEFNMGFADSLKTCANLYSTTAIAGSAATNLITIYQGATTYQVAIVASYNNDGFTLTWTKGAGSTAGTAILKFLCFR